MVNKKYGYLDKLNLFIGVYGQLFSGIFRFSWWSPFFYLAVLQSIGLAVLAWYYVPGLINVILPVLKIFLPEDAFHYPQYYLALPSIYSAFESFVLGPTFWVILSAVAVYRLGDIYAGRKSPLGEGLRRAIRAYLPLLLIWLIETAIVLLILSIPSLFLKSMLAGSPNRAAVIAILMQVAALFISASLIYSIPGIIIGKKGLGAALGDSVGLFFRNFFLTYFIVFIPSIIRIALNSLLSDFAPRIVNLLNPDLIPILVFTEILLGIFINLFIYGAAVFIYREMTE